MNAKRHSPGAGEGCSRYDAAGAALLAGSYRSLLLCGVSLAIGFVACGPSELSTPAKTVDLGVRFVSVHGNVQVRRNGTLEWIDATLAITLRQEDSVRTGKDGTAQIRCADGTELNVRPESLVRVLECSQDLDSRRPRAALNLQSGESDFRTPSRPGDRRIETPNGLTTPGPGAEGSIEMKADGATNFRVYKGEAQVEPPDGQRIPLGPKEAVAIDPEGKAGPKTTLPEVPVLTSPPNGFSASLPGPSRATTLLTWKGVAGTKSYRVVVDTFPTFPAPLINRLVFGNTEMELRDLAPGTYYWRVAASEANGTQGQFSSPWWFSLLEAQPAVLKPPQLALDEIELRAAQLHVKGRTEPGVSLTINGERIEVQPDGSFSEHIVLKRGTTFVSIRVVGVSGAVSEQRLPIIGSR